MILRTLGIYGADQCGRDVFELAQRINDDARRWADIVFVDDFVEQPSNDDARYITYQALVEDRARYECIISIEAPSVRERLFNQFKADGVHLTSLIDPSAFVSPTIAIPEGIIVSEYSTIHGGVELEANVLIQPYCFIEQDSRIGAHSVMSCFSAPGGGVIIGKGAYIGMKSCILDKLTIGEGATVIQGSVVHSNVAKNVSVTGNPARVISDTDSRVGH